MKYLLPTFILIGALDFGGVAVGDEPDLRNHFEAWGIPQLVSVSNAEASQVSGQGFVHHHPHLHRFAYAASRSASALPGTFTNNFAEASGSFLAEATSGALSELNSSVSGAHNPAATGPPGWHGHPGWYGFGWHPWVGGTGNRQISVGSDGFAFATRD